MCRCRDGVKVLWFYSHPVWLVYEGSVPTCACLTFLLTVYMWSAPIVLGYSLKKTYMYRMTYTIYIWKITIQLISVGLALACLNCKDTFTKQLFFLWIRTKVCESSSRTMEKNDWIKSWPLYFEGMNRAFFHAGWCYKHLTIVHCDAEVYFERVIDFHNHNIFYFLR